MTCARMFAMGLTAAVLAVTFTAKLVQAETVFPLTIKHAYGETVLAAKPERVATVAWANHEVPLALGVVPVGMARANFGDDDGDGVLPWVKARLDELGASAPTLFDEGDGIDFESVAATTPDVILAAYSGLSEADYQRLSQIAPVVPFTNGPWQTDWREMISLNAAGIGMVDEGKDLIANIETQISQTVQDYPQLSGKTAMFITHIDTTNLSVVRFYTQHDTRVKFFHDLGLSSPNSVAEASQSGRFASEISAERVDMFDDVDIIVTYGSETLFDAVKQDPLLANMPAIKHGSVVLLGRNPIGTAANPTPLSLPWVLKDYVALLANAVAKADQPEQP